MQVIPLGDQALLVEFDQRIDPEVNRQVIALHNRLSPGFATKRSFQRHQPFALWELATTSRKSAMPIWFRLFGNSSI